MQSAAIIKNNAKRAELSALTGIRFLAAFLVFIFHVQLQIGTPYLKFRIDNIVSQGALGVTLFFVLSGFLLTYSHLKDFNEKKIPSKAYYRKFIIKRLARVYPAYIVGLLLFALVSVIFESYPTNFFSTALLDVFMVQSFFPALEMAWYGGGGWSVSVELFFYLLFPFVLPLLLRIQKKETLLLLLSALIILSSVPGVLHNLFSGVIKDQHIHVYAFAPLRFPEFLCGIITGIFVFQFDWRISGNIAGLLLLVLAAYLMIIGGKLHEYTVHNIVALPAIMSLMCLCGQGRVPSAMQWLNSSVMQYLGKISYCFYIIQLPLLFIISILRAKHLVTENDQLLAPLFLVTDIALAAFLFHFVEGPSHSWILKRFVKKE